MTAHHQHMRAAEQVAPHVNAALMLLGNGVIEEKRLIERRADGRKARFIHRAAILRRQLCVFVVAAAPCGGDICKGSFHPENLQFYNVVGQPKPQPFPILGKGGGSGGYTPAACRRKSIAGTGGQGLAAENGGAMHP